MIRLLIQSIILAFLFLGCETPEPNPIANDPGEATEISGRLNQVMQGPTAGHCPDCSEQDRDVTRARSAGEFRQYENSPQVERMISTLRTNLTRNCSTGGACRGRRAPGSEGACLRYVKIGLMGGGFTGSYPPGLHARDFGPQLRRMGFRNLKDDPRYRNMTPEQAPKGAIIVYSGGPSGHIEVKAGSNEYLSDFRSSQAIHHRLPRRPIGIYIR